MAWDSGPTPWILATPPSPLRRHGRVLGLGSVDAAVLWTRVESVVQRRLAAAAVAFNESEHKQHGSDSERATLQSGGPLSQPSVGRPEKKVILDGLMDWPMCGWTQARSVGRL